MDISKLIKVRWEPPSGDGPYGWSSESYTVEIGDISIHTYTDETSAKKLATKLTKRINKFLENGEA